MKVKFVFTSRENCMIGVMFINNSQNMRIIDKTENTIIAEITKIDVNENLIIKFFAQPINVEILD